MRRREFITLIVGATATWPMRTSAQQTGKLPTIGFLGASASGFAPWAAAFCGPPARTRLGRGPARGPLLPQSGHTPLNVKAFECRISVRPVLGALALRTRLLSGWNQGRQYKKQCQRADSERRAANFLRVFLHNCLPSFGVHADHLSLRSYSICEAVHTRCDRCREIDKNVMPVTPRFPIRTAPPLWRLFTRLQPLQAAVDLYRWGPIAESPDGASLALLRRLGSRQTSLPVNVMIRLPRQKRTLECDCVRGFIEAWF